MHKQHKGAVPRDPSTQCFCNRDDMHNGRSRFLRINDKNDTRPNGDALKKCILEGPYQLTTVTIPVVPATDDSPEVPERTTVETILNMSPKNKEHYQSEKEAIHLLLNGIGDEIYSTVDACKTAHDMRIAIERLQQGESLNIQDVKTNLFWEFGKFTSHDGESMESYYSRTSFKNLNPNTCAVETGDSNVIPDSPDMCDNDIQDDQNDVECDDERVALANLIANLKLDVDENKKIQKQLKKANATLTQELTECKSILAETSRTLGESNSIRDSCLVALQNKQTEFERYKAFNDRTVDYDKLERKLNETLGLLAQKEIDIKEGLKVKAYEISVVKEKHDELVKQSLLTKSHYEGLVKEKTKVITDLKLKEEKDIDKMISMENQLKFLNEIVYKRSQSIQTIHMLAPKCPTFNGRPTFANPMYLKKAQNEIPCLYAIPHDQSDPANRLVPDREETLTLEEESRSKLNKDLVKPFDYTKLNSLYEIFKPPTQHYEIQFAQANEIRKKMWRKSFVKTKPNIFKNIDFLPVSKSISKSRQAYNVMTNNINHLKEIVDQAWVKHSNDRLHLCNPTAQDMEILIKTCLIPLALKTQNDSFAFVHELKQEMHADLKYVESLEDEIDELESDKAEFSNMYDMLLQECVSNDIRCSYLQSSSDLDEITELQCLYLHKVRECDCLAQKLSEQTEFVKQLKNDTVCKEKASNVFRKEREQYFEIQDLKAQLQDKNIAISELKKLIEKCKGKYVDTKFDKPSVVRQPNAQRIPKPSVLGKPAPFSDSLERKYFANKKSVSKTNESEGLSKPVTPQNLPQTATQAVRNTNVIKPGMYRIASSTTQTRAPQLTQTSRNTNPRVNSTSVNYKSVSWLKLTTQAWLWHRRLSHLNSTTSTCLQRMDVVIVSKMKDGENLDKMKEKGDPCILVGYSTQPKGYCVYNKRTRLIVESIHLRFDEIKEMSETPVANDTLGLVPQRQKVSNYDNPDPAPELQNVSPSAETTVQSQQELDLLFGPLYDEFFDDGTSRVNKSSSPTDNSIQKDTSPSMNIQPLSEPSTPTNVHAEENNDHQVEFTNPFCTPVQEIDESSSRNIGTSHMHTFNQPQDSEYRWTKDHPLTQVRGNLSKPVQTR
ncbi:hypothetical protein Tco_1295270 [Tanacetum coccineum]